MLAILGEPPDVREARRQDLARLRDFVLALLDSPENPMDPMDELARRLGWPRAAIESRWSEWVRRAKEAVG